jgi:hypothetical protein
MQDIRPPLSQRIKATASFWSRASAFATIFKSAGWMPLYRQRVWRFAPTPRLLGPCGHQQFKNTGGRGIGPKSAAQLLTDFQDLEGLYARLDEVPEKWRKKLEEHKEMAFVCRDISRLQTDIHIDGNLQQLRLSR